MSRITTLLRSIAACTCIALLGAGLAACGPKESAQTASSSETGASTASDSPITVVAAENTWGSLAEEIGGDQVTVTSILDDTSEDPTAFAPTSDEKTEIADAQVVIVNGAGYDDWASSQTNNHQTVINAASLVGATKGDNPYLWFSKDVRSSMATAIADELSKLAPDASDDIAQNLSTWQKEEEDLENTISSMGKDYSGTHYMATVPVGYYMFSELGLIDDTPSSYSTTVLKGQSPSDDDIQAFTEAISDDMKFMVSDSQHVTDAMNQLTGYAGRMDRPVVTLTEQMPESASTLDGWITSVLSNFGKQVSAADSSDGSSTDSPSDSASASTSATADATQSGSGN